MCAKSGSEIREAVRNKYSEAARGAKRRCACAEGCCAGRADIAPEDLAREVGYSLQEIRSVPEGANLGLGCGNPQALAALKPGETVLDLGSGGGFDSFLAAGQVGEAGRVIGVDMTPEMVEKARRNAENSPWSNVSFRLGEIEHLPVADAVIDVVLSNCVINLSLDKPQVFREIARVLKRGGRLAVSDIVAISDIPDEIFADAKLHASCVSGAARIEALEIMLSEAGFCRISIRPRRESGKMLDELFPGLGLNGILASAQIEAVKA